MQQKIVAVLYKCICIYIYIYIQLYTYMHVKNKCVFVYMHICEYSISLFPHSSLLNLISLWRTCSWASKTMVSMSSRVSLSIYTIMCRQYIMNIFFYTSRIHIGFLLRHWWLQIICVLSYANNYIQITVYDS